MLEARLFKNVQLLVLFGFIVSGVSPAWAAPSVAFVQFENELPKVTAQNFASIEEFDTYKKSALAGGLIITRSGANHEFRSFELAQDGSVAPINIAVPGHSAPVTEFDVSRLNATTSYLIAQDMEKRFGRVPSLMVVGFGMLMVVTAIIALESAWVIGGMAALAATGGISFYITDKANDRYSFARQIQEVQENTETLKSADVVVIECSAQRSSNMIFTCDDYGRLVQILLSRASAKVED